MTEKITEGMKVHESWYEEASRMQVAGLPEFVRRLAQDYEHDYGTICHAIAATALAAAKAMDRTPSGGITGFQAGAVMWEFIRQRAMELFVEDEWNRPRATQLARETAKAIAARCEEQARRHRYPVKVNVDSLARADGLDEAAQIARSFAQPPAPETREQRLEYALRMMPCTCRGVPERHAPDCPYAIARRALEEKGT